MNPDACAHEIVLVDDDVDALDSTSALLDVVGYATCSYSDGRAALAGLEAAPRARVLVTDVVMPGMDGVALAAKARAAVPGLCVIFVTGYSADRLRGVDFDRLLTKPWALDDLTEAIEHCLGHDPSV
jgi:CheY-like chemotaxis protein